MKGTLSVGTDSRPLDNWNESEIVQAINRRRHDGQVVCVRVHLTEACAAILLSTPHCAGGGGGRAPNECERRLFDLWNKHHLDRANYAPGDVISFLKQAPHLLN